VSYTENVHKTKRFMLLKCTDYVWNIIWCSQYLSQSMKILI